MAFLRVMVNIHFRAPTYTIMTYDVRNPEDPNAEEELISTSVCYVDPPRYRTWINDEMFVERSWLWPDSYAEEMFQVEATPGQYRIRVENLQPKRAKLKARNLRVDFGPGRVIDKSTIEVYDESQ
jgi:hypothetical protein